MSWVFTKVLAGHKGIESLLMLADYLFWGSKVFVPPGHPLQSPVLPGVREGEVERRVSRRAAWVEEPNKNQFSRR